MVDARSMTYAELADALGIGLESAKNLVRRKRWLRTMGNDGMARIRVPVEAFPERKPGPPSNAPIDGATDTPTNPPMITAIVDTLQRHVERLESELGAVRAERDQERARAAELALKTGQVEALQAALQAAQGERDRWHSLATAPRGLARLFRRA